MVMAASLDDALEWVGRMRMESRTEPMYWRPVAIALGRRTEERRQQLLFSSTYQASSRKSRPAALAWHVLNEIQTSVNMAVIQERARPASRSKWGL